MFYTQPNNYSCGPVAVQNVLSLFKKKHIGLNRLIEQCKCTRGYGTYFKDIKKVLANNGFKLTRVSRRTKRDAAYLLIVDTFDGGSHIMVSSRLGLHNYWNWKLSRFCKVAKNRAGFLNPFIFEITEK
jgi:predicted double-glycine peptidase